MKNKYIAEHIITGVEDICHGEVCTENGIILSVGKRDVSTDGQYNVIKCDKYLTPGFIDIHTHGGDGADFCDGTVSAFKTAAKAHYRHGTTALLPTSLTCSDEELDAFFVAMKEAIANHENGEASFCGAHLEGPYFSQKYAGAQDPRYLHLPQKDHYEPILKKWGSYIKRWSYAPELDVNGEFCATIQKMGIIPSAGHSNATEEEFIIAKKNGCSLLTHFCNAMSGMAKNGPYKHLGLIECGYAYDDVNIEVISDGIHVPNTLLKFLYRTAKNRTCIVSDCLRVAGLPDGNYYIGKEGSGQKIVKENGVALLEDRHAIAGSAQMLDTMVHHMVVDLGVSVLDAIQMASTNPARICNIENRGLLAKGYIADMVSLDENITVKAVFSNN